MLKAASIEILLARTICSGKYFIVYSGGVSDVEAANEAGIRIGDDAVIDSLTSFIEDALSVYGERVAVGIDALGVIETFSGVSALVAADTAGKAARVALFRLHIAMALGGKGLLLMTGSVSDVTAAVQAAADAVRERGLLVSELVIPRPSRELFADYV